MAELRVLFIVTVILTGYRKCLFSFPCCSFFKILKVAGHIGGICPQSLSKR